MIKQIILEVWKDVKGYKGLYQISDLGNVKSLFRKNNVGSFIKERFLKQNINTNLYLKVGLCKNGKEKTYQIHRLVAMAFLNHVPCGHKIVVDHIDNNKLNNHADNLQLITHRENSSKDQKGRSSKYIGVSWFKRDNKWQSKIQINGKLKHLGYFFNELDASKAYQNRLNTL